MSERERLLANRSAVHGLQQTQVQVEEIGRHVNVRDTYHSWANHFIKQSRKYFPRKQLVLYLNGGSILKLALFSWLLCFLGALSINGGSYRGAPAYCFILVAIWIAIFCQHETVSRKTLRLVLQQPVISEQRLLNNFYRVTVRELTGVALTNYHTGLGYLQLNEGRVEFQAFNPRALMLMKQARCYSRLFLFLFFIAAVYNFYFLVTYSLNLRIT